MDSVNSQAMLSRLDVLLTDRQQGDVLMAHNSTPNINVSEGCDIDSFVECQLLK